MEMIYEPSLNRETSNVAVRIRFSGSQTVDTYHLTQIEGIRFYSEWTAYLNGSNIIGGAYIIEEADRSITFSVNFSLISYIENGKIY